MLKLLFILEIETPQQALTKLIKLFFLAKQTGSKIMKTITRLTIILLLFSCLFGCIEKKENLTINSDGSLEVTFKIKGDKEDIFSGLDLPKGKQWEVKEWTQKEKSGKSYNYLATATFSNIAGLKKAMKTKAEDLKISNSLQIKKVNGNTYYFFKRVYYARNYWKYKHLKEKNLDKKLEERVSKKGISSLSKAEQEKFLNGVVTFETRKRILMVSDALGKAIIDNHFEHKLIKEAISKIEKNYENIISTKIIKKLIDLPYKKQALEMKKIRGQLSQCNQNVLKTIFKNLPNVNWQKYMKQQQLNCKLTEDLLDEGFKLTINMPGKIILTNGVQLSDKKVFWEFNGMELINRNVPIEIVSVVEGN